MLTDSGGFQVFSLADMRKVDEDGVTFRSHIDGSTHRFTPEKAIEIQEKLGADIIMAFDECSSPYDKEYSQKAMQRTHNWVERCLAAKTRPDQALFGIVQGGIFPDLREESARFISALETPGIAIGGLSVGETKQEMYDILSVVNEVLPEHKPRYLMGVGAPEDLVIGVLHGVDIFDCVLPTRLARHNAALTFTGRLNLMNARYAEDKTPIESGCTCYTCQTFTKGYIRHLIAAKEMLSGTLISIHNIHMLQQLMSQLRRAIVDGTINQMAHAFLAGYEYKPAQFADTLLIEKE
jgi:queuine tRNA-ribosyltransferase